MAACDAPVRLRPWQHAATIIEPAVTAERPATRTLRVAIDRLPDRLSLSANAPAASYAVLVGAVFETVLRQASGSVVDGVASATWHDDELVLSVLPGVKFADGRAMDAEDVRLSLEQYRPLGLLDHVTAIRSHDSTLTLQVEARDQFLMRALTAIPVLPRGQADITNGSGPYRVATSRNATRVTLVPHGAYWDGGEWPEVEWLALSPLRAQAALVRQDVDAIWWLPSYDMNEQTKAVAHSYPAPEVEFRGVLFSCHKGPLAHAAVRRALAVAADRSESGREPLLLPMWPGGLLDATPPDKVLHAPSLLDSAGVVDHNGDGVRERGGRAVRFALLATDAGRAEANRIAVAWRGLGLVVEVRLGNEGYVRRLIETGNFDAALFEWRGIAPADLGPLAGRDGTKNWGHCGSTTLDRALAEVRATGVVPPGMAAAWLETMPFATLSRRPVVRMFAKDVALVPQTLTEWLRHR